MKFKTRKFLNDEATGGTAFVQAEVSCYDNDNIDAEFKLGDCNRVVDLCFSVYSHLDSVNARAKVIMLRRAVVSFEKALIDELNEFDRRKK